MWSEALYNITARLSEIWHIATKTDIPNQNTRVCNARPQEEMYRRGSAFVSQGQTRTSHFPNGLLWPSFLPPPQLFHVGLCPLSDSVIIFVLHREKHAPLYIWCFCFPQTERDRRHPLKFQSLFGFTLLCCVSLKCPDLKHFIVSLLCSRQWRHSCFPRDDWECRVGRQALRNPALESQSQIVKHWFNRCSWQLNTTDWNIKADASGINGLSKSRDVFL